MSQQSCTISEKSLANLRPWQPGQSGNPLGRPATRSLIKALRQKLDVVDESGKTGAERLSEKLIELAMDGDTAALRECFDRIEGKPIQANVNVTIDESFQRLSDDEFTEVVERERQRRAAVPRIQVEQIPGSAPRPATIALRAPSDSK